MDDPVITTPEPDAPRGKVLQTFLVRVTLRANDDGTEGDVPTNDKLADIVEDSLYFALPDVGREAINVTAEKV